MEISASSANLTSRREGQSLFIGLAGEESERKFKFRHFHISINQEQAPGLIVHLPRSFKGALRISSIAGDVEVSDLRLSEGHIKTTAGDIKVGCLKGKEISLDSVSGDLSAGSCLQAPDIRLYSTSGDIDVKGILGNVKANTISGDIRLASVPENAGSKIDARSTSGEVTITGN